MLLTGDVGGLIELLGDFTELLPGDEPKLTGKGFGLLAG